MTPDELEKKLGSHIEDFVNHQHRGYDKTVEIIRSLAKSGSSKIIGDVTLSGGTGISLSQSGQNISIVNSATVTPVTDVQIFSTAGSFSAGWTKPTGAKFIEVHCFGAGGGGGSGKRGTNDAAAYGGAGGGAGAYAFKSFSADAFGATEGILVGAKGTGGAAKSTDGIGNDGVNGGISAFFAGSIKYVAAPGGSAGQGGQVAASATAGAGGVRGFGDVCVAGGAGGAGDGGSGSPGVDSTNDPSPRGGGAGSNPNNPGSKGGSFITYYVSQGNNTGGAASIGVGAGHVGTAGDPADDDLIIGGEGGGGGSGNGIDADPGNNGGAGGNGGFPGGGGGGGGGADSTQNTSSGKGGDGADGMVIVVSYF